MTDAGATSVIARRALLLGALAALPARAAASPGRGDDPAAAATDALAALEARHGGRLGVAVLESGTGRGFGRRADERFPLLSTFKVLAAGLVLARADAGEERLDRRVVVRPEDIVPHSPITGRRVGPGGMRLDEVVAAAMTLSDNAAANLLLDGFGGPPALTAFVRRLGDEVTRLDRRETALNEARPGDPRDTTTPAAMVATLDRLLFGDALLPASRERLAGWMIGNRTGDARLRAGLPPGWRAGDRTGTSGNGAVNDVGVAWPPGRPPLVIAAYYAGAPGTDEGRAAVLAEVGRIAARW